MEVLFYIIDEESIIYVLFFNGIDVHYHIYIVYLYI